MTKLNKTVLDKRIQKLYYDLYQAQMFGEWSTAEKIHIELRRIEKEESRKFDVS